MHQFKYLASTLSCMVTLSRLRYFREQAALTQQELAERAGLTRLTVMLLEQGQQQPRPATTRKLARALKIRPADLMAVEGHDG
jgi:transcriptional regulator with XRE-family HTH domain